MTNLELLLTATNKRIEELVEIFGENQINNILNFEKEIENIDYHPGSQYGNPVIYPHDMFTYGPGLRVTYLTGNLRRGRFPERAWKYYVCKEETE